MKCTAHSKRSHEPCRRDAMIGRSVCYHHGGKTPRGFALPQTKTGRYSKHLPTRLAIEYERARTDARLLELRDEISLLYARLADVLARVDTGESGRLWRELQAVWTRLEAARAAGDARAMAGCMQELNAQITAGYADSAAWKEVRELLQELKQLVDSERKREIAAQEVITSERAALLLGAVLGAIRRHVTDRTILNAIGDELGTLLTRETGPRVEGLDRVG